jgi:hypothetical protein
MTPLMVGLDIHRASDQKKWMKILHLVNLVTSYQFPVMASLQKQRLLKWIGHDNQMNSSLEFLRKCFPSAEEMG